MERSRTPGPEMPVNLLFVRPPRLVQEWIGRRVVVHSEVTTGGAKYPGGRCWTIEERSPLRGAFRLTGEPCACCGIRPRIVMHGNQLRDRAMVGFLPGAKPVTTTEDSP